VFFSIVIPTYNSSRVLRRCLEAIKRFEYPEFEIIVVDDGSTDDTDSMIKDYPDVKYIRQTNQGPAAARNKGAEAASGELIFFTDADCVPPPDILARYVSHFINSDHVGMGGGYRTFNADKPVARYIGREIQYRHRQARTGRIMAFGTYNCVFSRQVFLAAGGFDTEFKYASGEDFDFCYRLVESGHKLAFESDIFVWHEHPDSIANYFKQQYKRGASRTRNIVRHKTTAVHDNYVEKSVKWQPPLLAAVIAGIPITFFLPFFGIGWLVMFSGLLLLSNRAFYHFIITKDPALLPLAILMSFLKPIAWILGSIKFIFGSR